jgi:hypothetical protein
MYIRSKTTGRIIEIENQIFARTSSSWGWMAVRNHHPRQDKRSCFKSLCVYVCATSGEKEEVVVVVEEEDAVSLGRWRSR